MLLALYSRFLFKNIRIWIGKFTVIIIIALSCCYIYGSKIEPNWIEVVSIDLTIPNLDSVFNNFKIVQVSDLHSNYFMPESRLNKIIKSVNQQQPDAIAITGDFVTQGRGFNDKNLISKFSRLEAKAGVLSVLGNHDHWKPNIARLQQILVQSQINNLENGVYLVERGSQQLAIAGIDDPYWGKPDLQQAIAQLPSNVPAILLVHEPDYIEKSALTHRFALQLSGHSHGGQIKIPFLDPFILPKGGRKYFAGLNQVEDTIIYTSRGLGMTGLPLRFGSRPEITVFTLHNPA